MDLVAASQNRVLRYDTLSLGICIVQRDDEIHPDTSLFSELPTTLN